MPVQDRILLNFTAFISGAVLMGLELVGSRILAPYFGNSIFVWGSLISVFLLSLSTGYFVGGKIADRHPSRILLGGIIVFSGIIIFCLTWIFPLINSYIFDLDFGYKWNPLAASLILFILPGIGMGIVSPFVVKLSADKLENIGNTSGKIYAISTAGSITGTLLTAFFMIPAWGTKTDLKILGLILSFTGLLLIIRTCFNKS